MYYLGIDLGGTNIAVGVVDETGKILHKSSTPTGVGREVKTIIGDMGMLCQRVVREAGLKMEDIGAAGIGIPGLSKDELGEIIFSNNLYWHNVPIVSYLREYLSCPIHIDNDANVAALGECVCGGMKGAKNAVLLTLGTGVGGGIVMDGKIIGGTHHVGAEIGHLVIMLDGEPCTCGSAGCLERYTSATALIREGRKTAEADPKGMIYRSCRGNLDRISAKMVIDCAKAGDPGAELIFKNYIHALALGIVSIINFIDPESIALGGGVAAAGDFLLDPLKKEVAKYVFYKTEPYADIVMAQLGNDAGIIGAAFLGKQGAGLA